MASKLDLMLEAERRGILPADKVELLAEARKRGLVKSSEDGRETLSWSDVPGQAIQNLGSSAANFANAVAQPFLHPVDTAKAIGAIGGGLVSKAEGALGVAQDPEEKAKREAAADAVGQFYSGRYGSQEGFKRALAEDPVGVMADFAAVLTGGGGALARAPGVVGKAGEVVRTAGSIVDPISNAGRAASFVGNRAADVLGMTTGAGSTPIRNAFQAGRDGNQVFTDNMRGKAPMEDTIGMAKSAVGEMRQARSDAYQTDIGQTFANKQQLNTYPIYKSIAAADKSLKFAAYSKSPGASKVMDDIRGAVQEWKDSAGPGFNTAEGMDALKQRIGDIMEKLPRGSNERRVAERVYNSVKGEIVKQAPEYAKTMQDYASASSQIKELERTFSLGDKAAQDTTLRKLQSTQRNNVNTNYGQRAKLLDELAQYEPDLPAALAGQALNSPTPRGLQSYLASGTGISALMSNPTALAVMPAFSPRLVGEGANALGRFAGVADATVGSVPVSTETMRNALLQAYLLSQTTQPALRGGIGPRYDENGNPRQPQ